MCLKIVRQFLLVIALLCIVGVHADESSKQSVVSRPVLLDRVVAVVGNASILLSEVGMYAEQLQENNRNYNITSDRDPQAEALEDLMIQKLLATQAQIDSVDVDLSQVTLQIEMQIEQMKARAGGVRELEIEQNMEVFNIRDAMRRRMEETLYAQAMQGDIMGSVVVIPGEVEQYYRRSDRDSLPLIGEQYRYAQITRFPASMEDAKRRVVERLLDMRERIINGKAKFSSLAQMYSADPGSAYRGGEMEPQPSTAFVPAFAEALELLKPGQMSGVVETDFGFHIIELIDKRDNYYHCRHILLRPSYSAAELMEPINYLDSLVLEIRRDSITFESAAMLHSDDASTKMNGGIVTNHDLLERYNAYDAKLTVTKFLKEDFGARGYKSLDDFTALSRLKVGEVSDAFTTEDMMGNQLSKIVKLIEIFPAHVASIDEDYIKLEEMALLDKQEKVLSEWLKRHISSAYVYIDPEFRNLEFEHEGWVK